MTKKLQQFETIQNPWDDNPNEDDKILCHESRKDVLIYRKKQELKNTLLQIDQIAANFELNTSLLINYLDLINNIDQLEHLKRFTDSVVNEIDYIKSVLAKSDLDHRQIAKDLIFSLNMKIGSLVSKKYLYN